MNVYQKAVEKFHKIAESGKRARRRGVLHDEKGREIPDPTPIAPPLGYVSEPTLAERIRSMVRSEHLRLAVEAAGAETFDEADDFDIGDDFDPTSPYEESFDPVEEETRMRLRQRDFERSVTERVNRYSPVQEDEHGNASVNEGRDSDPGSGSRRSSEEREGKPSSESKSSDKGSLRKGGGSSRDIEE